MPVDADAPLAQAVRNGEPVFVASRAALVEAWPHLASYRHAGQPLEGLVTMPLVVRGATIGAMAFSFYAPTELDNVQRDFYRTVADLCAHVLERARSIEAERDAHRALRRHQEQLDLLARAGDSLVATLIRAGPSLSSRGWWSRRWRTGARSTRSARTVGSSASRSSTPIPPRSRWPMGWPPCTRPIPTPRPGFPA